MSIASAMGLGACIQETIEAAPAANPEPTVVVDAPAEPRTTAPQMSAGPPDGWVSIEGLPTVSLAEVPASSAWPDRVRASQVPGWHLAHVGPSVSLGPHSVTDGVFASKASARTFRRTGQAEQAEVGTCFKAVWPSPDRQTKTSDVHDLDPLLIPEPHVRHRGGWDSTIGWVQGTRWLGVSEDGRELRLEIAEAWVRAGRTRIEAIGRQEIVLSRIDSPIVGWALFAAVEGDGVHLLVVPHGADGRPATVRGTTAPAPNHSLQRSLGCIWRRFTVTRQAATHELYLDARARTVKSIDAVVVEHEGELGLVVRSP